MKVCLSENDTNYKGYNKIAFKSNPIINATSFIEERVLLNKALLDGAKDVSFIVNSNNRDESEERFIRSAIAWTTAFLTPLITLPLTNRLAMRHIAKLSKSFLSKENNLIELSNKYLTSAKATKQGIEELSRRSDFSEILKENNYDYEQIRQNLLKNNAIKLPKKYLKSAEATKEGIEELSKKYDFSELLKRNGYDYEKIRKNLINAKMSVLAFDFLFTSGTLGSAGFINRRRTRRKTSQDGFSAEFKMADKNIVEKRAEKYKKTEDMRDKIFLSIILAFATTPLLLRKGLLNSSGKLADFAKKYGSKFDYNDGIFMQRLPFLLMTLAADSGFLLSSRNKTEVKDNAVRLSLNQIAYFGADIVIGSALAVLSDKLFKTDLLDKNCKKNWINKIIPPIKPIRELQGKNKAIATGLFWVNMLTLFGIVGIAIPKMLNKMIRHDVEKDVVINKSNTVGISSTALKRPSLQDFIKREI